MPLSIVMKNTYLKAFVVVWACFFSTFSVDAQENLSANGDTYFFLGFSLPIFKIRDEGHSPQTYIGMTPTFRIGYERVGRDVVERISAAVGFGDISPKGKPKPLRQMSSAEVTNFQVTYAQYRRVGDFDTEGYNRYVGGAFTFVFDARGYNLPSNNLFGFQVNTSLNVGGFVWKKLSDEFRANYEAFMPFITYSVRPNYIGMVDLQTEKFKIMKVIKSGKVVTVNKAFRFYNRLCIDQQINDHRQRRLAYSWDFHSNIVSKPLRSVAAGLTYESLFKM